MPLSQSLVGVLWSAVKSALLSRHGLRPASLSPSKGWAEVTSCK